MMNQEMIKTIFFDLYGTLAGFKPSRFEVQSEACSKFGISVTQEGIVQGYALADTYMAIENAKRHLRLRTVKQREHFFSKYEQLIIGGCGVKISLERALKLWQKIREIPYTLAPFSDVIPTLECLKTRGLTLGMITNMDTSNTYGSICLAFKDLLDLTITSVEVGVSKPDPAIFFAALYQAKSEPHEAIHIGDQISSDIEGASGAGITPILIDRDGIHKDYRSHTRIEALTDILEFIDLSRSDF